MGANYSINVKSKAIDTIREIVKEYRNSPNINNIISEWHYDRYKEKFALTIWENKSYTLITSLEYLLLKDDLAQILSERLNCLCLYIDSEEGCCLFSVKLFDCGKCISHIYAKDIIYAEGEDEDGIPWVDSKWEFHSEMFDIDLFCEKLGINNNGKEIILKEIEEHSFLLPGVIDNVMEILVDIDMDTVMYAIKEKPEFWVKCGPQNTEFIE